MIESYLGQNTFLWKAFVNSCEENLSPEMVMVTCMGGKYCTCSHVFGTHVCTHAQWSRCTCTKRLNTHVTHTHAQTQMSWPLTVCHVPLISVTLVIKSVSIFLTSAPQQCEYTVHPDTYSLAHHLHLSSTYTHANWIACTTICQQEIYMRACWN